MLLDLMGNFPYDRHPVMRVTQRVGLEGMRHVEGVIVREAPVGTGKTAIGITYLEAAAKKGLTRRFFIQPNKALVQQVQTLYPNVRVAYGRNEHPCLYYPDENLTADEVPCAMLGDCPHRVDQLTGETFEEGAIPCPYLKQKFEAKQMDKIVVCTNAFFIFTVLFSGEFVPEAVVVDEVHGLANSIRSVLQTEITDWKIERAVDVLDEVSPRQCEHLALFLSNMKRMVKRHAMGKEVLLDQDQVKQLYKALMTVHPNALQAEVRRAVASGKLDKRKDREVLKQLDDIVRSVTRFQHALKFAMNGMTQKGYPLNFVIAFGKTDMGERDRVQYRITVKDYYVAPLINKVLPEHTLAMSATIGDPDLLAFETGIKGDFASLPSTFPPEHARIYMPTDTANLAVKQMGLKMRGKNKMLRLVVDAAKRFARKDHRSLVLVVSNEEREKFVTFAQEAGLHVLTYGNGMTAKECVLRFRDGEGDCLVGTNANFGQGIDLPKQTAPVTFCLRPAYPRPSDPQTQFEEQRFGKRRWPLWNWRVIIDLLQARGRNIRSEKDRGVTFLISQQYRRFAFASLPEWLKPAYRGNMSFEDCVKDAMQLLE
jgi:Rad3-related DNA helicase